MPDLTTADLRRLAADRTADLNIHDVREALRWAADELDRKAADLERLRTQIEACWRYYDYCREQGVITDHMNSETAALKAGAWKPVREGSTDAK